MILSHRSKEESGDIGKKNKAKNHKGLVKGAANNMQ